MPRRLRRPPRIGPLTHIRREPEGWGVAVVRQGRRLADYFGDGVYGGRGRALLAAQHFRDRALAKDIGPDARVRTRAPAGRRSRTGVVGVTRELHHLGGRTYHRYVARWPDLEKGPLRRRFSTQRYGETEARALAIEARDAGVARYRAALLTRQRVEAEERLRRIGPMPRPVKDPRARAGISMARRRAPMKK